MVTLGFLSLFLPRTKGQCEAHNSARLLILAPTLLWVGLGLEALICLLSTYPTHFCLNAPSPVPCPASAMSTPLQ